MNPKKNILKTELICTNILFYLPNRPKNSNILFKVR